MHHPLGRVWRVQCLQRLAKKALFVSGLPAASMRSTSCRLGNGDDRGFGWGIDIAYPAENAALFTQMDKRCFDH